MSRTNHPRIAGTHRAWPSRRDEDWSGELAPRRLKAVMPQRVAITEGLAVMAEDQPMPWWALTPERDLECTVIDRHLDNARLMEDLADMDAWDRRYDLPAGHENLLPFIPRAGGWSDPDEPDYWDDESDQDEDLDPLDDLRRRLTYGYHQCDLPEWECVLVCQEVAV